MRPCTDLGQGQAVYSRGVGDDTHGCSDPVDSSIRLHQRHGMGVSFLRSNPQGGGFPCAPLKNADQKRVPPPPLRKRRQATQITDPQLLLSSKETNKHRRITDPERAVKYHAALLVPCACMMYTTRPQALSLPGKECMLANYICVCDNINNTCTCSKVSTYFNVVVELRS